MPGEMIQQIHWLLLANPFNWDEKKDLWFDYKPGASLQYYFDNLDYEFTEDVNLHLVIRDIEIPKSDWSTYVPKADDVVILVAKIEAAGAAIFATWAANAFATWAGYSWVAYYAAYGVAMVAYYAALTYGMSVLISSLTSIPDKDGGSQESVYGWGTLQNTQGQGNPIQILFGKHLMSGHKLNSFVDYTGEDINETLHSLFGLGDGPFHAISDIRINNQPYENFADVTIEIGLGTDNGEAMSDFDRVVTHHPLRREAELDVAINETLPGTGYDSIEVDLVAPSGIYRQRSSGSTDSKTVDLDVSYIPDSGGSTVTQTVQMSGSDREAIHKKVVFDNLQSGTDFTITVEKISGTDGTSQKRFDQIYWTAYRGVIQQELVYPGIAKYGIHALATNQISGGEPVFTCIAEKYYISTTDAYWNTKHLTNPAWACLALLVHYRKIPASRIELADFTEWANWCQPDGPGGANERIAINYIIDIEGGFWDQLQKIAQLGRGVIVRKGWKYAVIIDREEDVRSHVFNTANTVKGSFNITYMPKVDRANIVEATFKDEDRRYETSTVAVYSADFLDSTQESKKATVEVFGITKRDYVLDKATLLLNSNKYLLRTLHLQAKIDSFSCVVSDRVGIRHDIVNHETGSDGRIVSATSTTVVLDVPVFVDGDKTYGIFLRHSSHNIDYSDQFETELLVNPESSGESGMHSSFTLNNNWTTTPAEGDLYSFGETDSIIKDYRITNITRADDFTREIQLIEYIAEIYTDGAPIYAAPPWDPKTQEAINVTIKEHLQYTPAGTYQSSLSVSWTPSLSNSGFAWSVWLVDVTDSDIYAAWIDAHPWTDSDPWHEVDSYPVGVPRKIGVTSDIFFVVPYRYLALGRSYTVIVSPANGGPVAQHAWVSTESYIAGNVISHSGFNYSSLKHNNLNNTPVVPSIWWALVGGNESDSVMIQGKWAVPNNVLALSALWKPFTRTIAFGWVKIEDVDLDHYEIRQGESDPVGEPSDPVADWASALVVPELVYLVGETEFYYVENPTNAVIRFWIKAFDTSGLESETPTYFDVLVDTTAAEIEIPTGLDYSTGEDEIGVYVTASWNDNSAASDLFSRYEVKLINNETGWSDIVSVEDPYNTWYVVGNVSYSLQVQAVDKNNQATGWSSAVLFISAMSTKAPSDISWPGESWEIVPGFRTIGFSWNFVIESDLIGYHIQRATNTGFTEGLSDLGIKIGNQFIDTGLDIEVEYFYRVKGVNKSEVESENWSAVKSATTLLVGSTDIAYGTIYADHMRSDQAYVATIQSNNWIPEVSGFKLDSETGHVVFYNVTMTLEATNVSGLGDLATQDTVDYDHIQGIKPPYNADITSENTALDTVSVNGIASTTLIKGGFIGTGLVKADSIIGTTLSAVKTSTGSLYVNGILTVGAAGSIRCGSPWEIPGGYRLDMYDGEPRFKVGNADKYMYYRPSTGLFIEGPVVVAGNIEAKNVGISGGNENNYGGSTSVVISSPSGVTQDVVVIAWGAGNGGEFSYPDPDDPGELTVTISGGTAAAAGTQTGFGSLCVTAMDILELSGGSSYTFTASLSGSATKSSTKIAVLFLAKTGE